MKQKNILLMLFVLLTFAVAQGQVANTTNALLGAWSGKLDLGAAKLTLVFHFEQKDGFVACTMDSPDQGAKGIGVYKD